MPDHLSVALNAVTNAAQVCRQIQSQLVRADSLTKKDRSPVTIADLAAQALICRELKRHFPELPIIAEEDAGSLRQAENRQLLEKILSFLPGWSADEVLDSIDHGNGQAADEVWTLDPIDGTKGFLRGDQYAVALALIRHGLPVLGVLGCPNLDLDNMQTGLLFYTKDGSSAFARSLDGSVEWQVSVSQNTPADGVRFLESVESSHANFGLQSKVMSTFGARAKSVRYDSQAKYGVLAAGRADVYLRLPNPAHPDYREKIWDHAAGVAVVQAAGGRASDMFGRELDFGQGKQLQNSRGVVVTNGLLHDTIIETIKSDAQL